MRKFKKLFLVGLFLLSASNVFAAAFKGEIEFSKGRFYGNGSIVIPSSEYNINLRFTRISDGQVYEVIDGTTTGFDAVGSSITVYGISRGHEE